jgi:predicted restriction endonuclease
MSVIDEVRNERESLAQVLKQYSGIRKIVEDAYPDNAHFIYELLQNAEDCEATAARFLLFDDKLRFEHNGIPFSSKDIEAITNIGDGAKTENEDKIGRFGVGFKSVFAYSETPYIWSQTFSFRITELVLPWELEPDSSLGGMTRFDFPFNNPKKQRSDAHREIENGLNDLAETTLLFLRHIESLEWCVEGRGSGEVLRVEHADHHVEILKRTEGKETSSAHFLKFVRPVVGLEQHHVSIAFSLGGLPNPKEVVNEKPLSEQFKIVPTRGQVAVFFPAARERSGLRFHLHAPFVPELSRASIKGTRANKPLFDQLAELAAASLHSIRDQGLLSMEFLEVLPNKQEDEDLEGQYIRIRESIISEMNDKPLTPTSSGEHAPARRLFQANRAWLKALLNPEDLAFFAAGNDESPQWAAGVRSGSKADRFMRSLAIHDLNVDTFVGEFVRTTYDKNFLNWLAAKDAGWHQQLYAFLADDEEAQRKSYELKKWKIVRLSDGKYKRGSECHFSDEKSQNLSTVHYVDAAVYTMGEDAARQEKSKRFLADIGVTEIGERQIVEYILKTRYGEDAQAPDEQHISDIRLFMKFVCDQPYYQYQPNFESLDKCPIFWGKDEKWHNASAIYLDKPYLDTALGEYLAIMGSEVQWFALADLYQELSGPEVEGFIRFAKRLGVNAKIKISVADCSDNPEWGAVLSKALGQWTNTSRGQDYRIGKFELLSEKISERLSRLVWDTIRLLPNIDSGGWYDNPLWATYQYNKSCGPKAAPSQLVYQLRQNAWVPQTGGSFVEPRMARADLLPKGFEFNAGWNWIEAIKFGVDAQQNHQESAEALGFSSVDLALRLAKLPNEELERLLAEYARRDQTERPDRNPLNPSQRAKKVLEEACSASQRSKETRPRSVSVDRDDTKTLAREYLRDQYTQNGQQFCQICWNVLPFKTLDDEEYYFEAVELMPQPQLRLRHRQNYLCLCPNHAAMFMHANGSAGTIKESIAQLDGTELPVTLARQDMTIHFTETHLVDLKSVIQGDDQASTDGSTPFVLDAAPPVPPSHR